MSRQQFTQHLSRFLAMFVGILSVVSAATMVNVDIALSKIDMADPSTWPNMAPQVQYYFAPIIAAQLAVIGLLINTLLYFATGRKLKNLTACILVGFAYGLTACTLPLMGVGFDYHRSLIFCCIFALSVVALVWRNHAIKRNSV